MLKIAGFLGDGTRRVFAVHGLAGVGKSHLLAHVGRRYPEAMICAPTGKAASVLRERHGLPATTIHAVFHRLRSETRSPAGRVDLEFEPRRRDGSLAGDVLLLDEASMVDVKLRDQLLRTGIRIVSFGDPGQLGPVHGEPGFPEADVTLTTIHRQAADSPIIRQAHRVRAGEMYARDGDAFRVVPRGTNADLREADVVLCWRNENRRWLNQLLRRVHGRGELTGQPARDGTFDPATEYPRADEWIIVLNNAPKFDLWNGTRCWLAEDFAPGETTVTLRMGPYDIEVPNTRFVGMPSIIPEGREDLLLDFGGAMTVHKSQGSEWRNVMIFDEFSGGPKERAAWVYTALTRASERVTVVNSTFR